MNAITRVVYAQPVDNLDIDRDPTTYAAVEVSRPILVTCRR